MQDSGQQINLGRRQPAVAGKHWVKTCWIWLSLWHLCRPSHTQRGRHALRTSYIAFFKHILPKCRRPASSLFLARLLQHLLQPLSGKKTQEIQVFTMKMQNITEITDATKKNCTILLCQLSKLTVPEFKSYLFVGLPVTPNTPFINELISTERSFMILSW